MIEAILDGAYVCREHGERATVKRVAELVDGVVVLPGSVECSECGAQLRIEGRQLPIEGERAVQIEISDAPG